MQSYAYFVLCRCCNKHHNSQTSDLHFQLNWLFTENKRIIIIKTVTTESSPVNWASHVVKPNTVSNFLHQSKQSFQLRHLKQIRSPLMVIPLTHTHPAVRWIGWLISSFSSLWVSSGIPRPSLLISQPCLPTYPTLLLTGV